MVSILLAQEVIFGQEVAEGFELKMVAPGQTFEKAMSEIRGHAQALLQIKSLIESESWGEAQKVLRKNSAYLKQDIYTIIQGIPGNERPELRKLYSNLFNNATRVILLTHHLYVSWNWRTFHWDAFCGIDFKVINAISP